MRSRSVRSTASQRGRRRGTSDSVGTAAAREFVVVMSSKTMSTQVHGQSILRALTSTVEAEIRKLLVLLEGLSLDIFASPKATGACWNELWVSSKWGEKCCLDSTRV